MNTNALSAYTVCKNALIASGYSIESSSRLAKRFSANKRSVDDAVSRMNAYLKQ